MEVRIRSLRVTVLRKGKILTEADVSIPEDAPVVHEPKKS